MRDKVNARAQFAKRESVEDWENGQELIKFLDQLDIFESCGKKAEIECLESLFNGHVQGDYLTKFYLPSFFDSPKSKSLKNRTLTSSKSIKPCQSLNSTGHGVHPTSYQSGYRKSQDP